MLSACTNGKILNPIKLEKPTTRNPIEPIVRAVAHQ
jgi:hypothetical protein